MSYWNSTGLPGEEITKLYQRAADDQLALLYTKEEETGGVRINAAKMVTTCSHQPFM